MVRTGSDVPLHARASICWPGRILAAGGRPSFRPMSRWMPRTCCCGSFSAFATPGSPSARRNGFAPQQREDGSWAKFWGGPGDLSTTAEAYVALRLAGDEPEAAHMQAASAFVRAAGGLQKARVFTHIWLALFGAWSWDRVPTLPPEMMLLPPWFPLNPYDFACWARQTVVALSVVLAYRPARRFDFTLDELYGEEPWSPPSGSSLRARALLALDRVLRAYQRRPLRRLREHALARAERWIVDRQEADGSWGGIQPPWVYSLIALHLRGYQIDHPVIRRGLDGLGAVRHRGGGNAPARGLPIAGLGHRAGPDRARRQRASPR